MKRVMLLVFISLSLSYCSYFTQITFYITNNTSQDIILIKQSYDSLASNNIKVILEPHTKYDIDHLYYYGRSDDAFSSIEYIYFSDSIIITKSNLPFNKDISNPDLYTYEIIDNSTGEAVITINEEDF